MYLICFNINYILLIVILKGAQEMFQELPHMYVPPHELKHAMEKGGKLTITFLITSCRACPRGAE